MFGIVFSCTTFQVTALLSVQLSVWFTHPMHAHYINVHITCCQSLSKVLSNCVDMLIIQINERIVTRYLSNAVQRGLTCVSVRRRGLGERAAQVAQLVADLVPLLAALSLLLALTVSLSLSLSQSLDVSCSLYSLLSLVLLCLAVQTLSSPCRPSVHASPVALRCALWRSAALCCLLSPHLCALCAERCALCAARCPLCALRSALCAQCAMRCELCCVPCAWLCCAALRCAAVRCDGQYARCAAVWRPAAQYGVEKGAGQLSMCIHQSAASRGSRFAVCLVDSVVQSCC